MRDPRLLVRVASGLIFVVFGAAKFLNHGAEVDSFETYGLPSPSAFVYAIGTIEVAGGVMLLLGRGVRLAALVLAGDMVGAIVVSGIKEGEAISLTLAPLLLIGMLYLLSSGRQGYSRAP
jgi:putative oxidoreductase